jgi:NAD(P)-dependent dehydrogenase (short-subunit alcohol dehydrogenase family)
MATIAWNFTGRTALVTGASRGIGLATANLLAGAGAHVVAASRTGAADGGHPALRHVVCDVTDSAQLATAVAAAAEPSGRLDICVANAAVVLVEDFATSDPEEWRALLSVNTVSVMETFQLAAAKMTDGDGGRLIAISSGAGLRGEPDVPAYSASKAALGALVQALAVGHAAARITANAVAPGEIDTHMNHEARAGVAGRRSRPAHELLDEMVERDIPAGRLGTAEEVAALVAFLASDEASYVTGQTIAIDGGQLLV